MATGNTLEEIRKEWQEKKKAKTKGYADIDHGHRTDFSERSQACMAEFFKWDILPNKNEPEESAEDLWGSPALVYLTVNKGHKEYSILDLGGIEMAIMLAAKDHGVDSIPAYFNIMYPDILRKHLKISDKEDIVIGIALGYEQPCLMNEHRSKKLTFEEACKFFK